MMPQRRCLATQAGHRPHHGRCCWCGCARWAARARRLRASKWVMPQATRVTWVATWVKWVALLQLLLRWVVCVHRCCCAPCRAATPGRCQRARSNPWLVLLLQPPRSGPPTQQNTQHHTWLLRLVRATRRSGPGPAVSKARGGDHTGRAAAMPRMHLLLLLLC